MRINLHPIFKPAACAAVIACGFAMAPAANATVILTFGQSVDGTTVTATANAADTQTTIVGMNIPITITQYAGAGAPISAYLDFDVISSNAATVSSGQLLQSFNGSLSFTSQMNGLGINYLSSTFVDFVFGTVGGSSYTLNSSQPPGTVAYTSDILDVSSLGVPRAFSLAFADVTPPGSIVGTTLAGFVASVSGTASSTGTPRDVPEPGSLALLGVGLGGIGSISEIRRRRRAAKRLTSSSDMLAG